jgi:hypothetical protein
VEEGFLMALSALVVWEVRTSGNDGNGGGFHTGATGTDFSVQDAAQATLSAASVVHSTTTQINVAPGDFTVSAADVGNLLNITSGTATLGVYEITVVDVPNNRWTVDRSVGSVGQTTIGAMGGAMATPGRACQFSVSTNIIYIKAGTYTMTTGSSNVSNGVLNKTNTFVEGYETTRGDLGTPPLLQADGVITVFTLANLASCDVVNINFDANNRATARCLIVSNGFAYKCKFSNATNEGIQLGAAGLAIFCEATGCSAQSAFRLFSAGAACYFCYAHDNTVNGFSIPTGGMCVNCIAETNTGSTDGFVLNGPGSCINCTAYNNGREGIRIASNGVMIVNCIAEGNGTVGIRNSSNTSAMYLINNAGVNNGTSNVDMGTGKFNANIGFVTGSASFFTDAANGDFSLNNSAGGGALARNAGIPGVFPNGTTTGFEDIGAVQHEDSGGGGGGSSAVLRGVNMIPYKTNYY